jgi:hypothetical protein
MSQFDFVHRTEGFEPCSAGSTIENQFAVGICRRFKFVFGEDSLKLLCS